MVAEALLPTWTGIERERAMARDDAQSDGNFSADAPRKPGDPESLRRLLDQTELLEAFDEAARRRFGKMISDAAVGTGKHRWMY